MKPHAQLWWCSSGIALVEAGENLAAVLEAWREGVAAVEPRRQAFHENVTVVSSSYAFLSLHSRSFLLPSFSFTFSLFLLLLSVSADTLGNLKRTTKPEK